MTIVAEGKKGFQEQAERFKALDDILKGHLVEHDYAPDNFDEQKDVYDYCDLKVHFEELLYVGKITHEQYGQVRAYMDKFSLRLKD